MRNVKPLGYPSLGSIPHLPSSRLGPGDHRISDGQARIATEKARDKHDLIWVQEKLDGSCTAVALVNGDILALGRSGYLAQTSSYEQHQRFADWVRRNESRFRAVLQEGERLCGEWLLQAHGTRYEIPHEPWVAFDLMRGTERTPVEEFLYRLIPGNFVHPTILHKGGPLSIADALSALGSHGHHGALDEAEGIVYRIERHELARPGSRERRLIVDFLTKFVRSDKVDGCYLPEVSGKAPVWNYPPAKL